MIRDLSGDFFRFLDSLTARSDIWSLYRRHYLNPHRQIIDAVRDQVLGVDRATWRDRVERIKLGDYSGLRALLAGADVEAATVDALRRCREVLRGEGVPDVYLLVGFFSPDAFLIEVGSRRQIAIGLERLRSSRQIPLLVAHEYGHWVRRLVSPAGNETLGERMASEGISIVLTRAVYPGRPLAEHLGVPRSRLNALQDAEDAGWRAITPRLGDSDPQAFERFLSGVAPGCGLPPRIGVYLGYRAARALQRREHLALPELAKSPWERFFAAKPGLGRV